MSPAGGFWRNDRGQVRSGWRLVLWLGAVSVLLVASSILGVDRLPTTAANAVRLLLVALGSVAAWRILDGRGWSETWLKIDRGASLDLGRGFFAGALLVGIALLPVATVGSLEILPHECRVQEQGEFFLVTGAFFLVAAALEELLFRGYPLFALASGPGRIFAVAVTSGIFALLHAANPHFDTTAGLLLFGIGAVLAVSVLQRGSIWEALGAHVGWNWTLASGMALPVSGIEIPSPCYSGALSGPTWLTGGGFGLEAGVGAALAWAMAASLLWRRGRRSERRSDT